MRDPISNRSRHVDASGIRKVFDLAAKLKNPLNLSIGLPDFDVPDSVKTIAIQAIQNGQNRYTPTQGIEPLRQRLRRDLSAEWGRDAGEVLITSGVSGGLLLAILAVIDPGDEVVFLDPYFVMYRHLLTIAGGKAAIVDSYPDFRFRAADVEKAITPRTKMLILNSPSNPTGIVMTRAEVQAAVDLAKKHNLLILSDEIYEPFLYDIEKNPPSQSSALSPQHSLPSPAPLYENTLVLRGFSKSHAMTGWRLGYAAGPAEIVAEMTKLQQYTFVCAPSPFQQAALAALDVPMDKPVADYRRKRDLACSLLSRKFEIAMPQGAFYIFPKAPAGMTASQFVSKAIENNVLIIPGNVFSARDTHFRVSYAATDEVLRQGCEVLCSLA
jgi:aspartate aminotransferase/aminotransferase